MFTVEFYEDKADANISRVGGGVLLPDFKNWPADPDMGIPMTPFLTLRQDAFAIPTIPDGMALTVFLSVKKTGSEKNGVIDKIEDIVMNDDASRIQYKPDEFTKSRVLLHHAAKDELFHPDCVHFPALYIQKEMAAENIQWEDMEDEDIGLRTSKIFGRPGWIRGIIFEHPRLSFLMQIFEKDLAAKKAEYKGLFSGGAGYVYFDRNIPKMREISRAGAFIIQHE